MGSPGQDWTTERGERHRSSIRIPHEATKPASEKLHWLAFYLNKVTSLDPGTGSTVRAAWFPI
jgi:hypothetical protein